MTENEPNVKTFEYWEAKYEKAPRGSQEETDAIANMAELATTIDQLDTVAIVSSDNPEIQTPALEKMAKKATTRSDWKRIWYSSPDDSEMEKRAEEEMKKFEN